MDAAPIVSSATAILLGGTAATAVLASSTRASLAPQEPFFRLGIVGVTVPALQIGGAIGTQLGYLAAAGVGTGNFVILVIVGWAFNHRTQISEWRVRRQARQREAEGSRAPSLAELGAAAALGRRRRAARSPIGGSLTRSGSRGRRSIASSSRGASTPSWAPGRARRSRRRARAPRRFFSMPAGLPRAPWTNAAASLITPWISSRSARSRAPIHGGSRSSWARKKSPCA